MIDACGERHHLAQVDRHDAVLAPQPLAGDCGAFGIKTAITLNVMPRPQTTLSASFAFREGDAAIRVMAALADLPNEPEGIA